MDADDVRRQECSGPSFSRPPKHEDAEFAIGVFQVASTSPNVTPKRKQWCRRQIEEYQRRLNELREDP